jgi:uncharacterized membrane protein
VSKARGETFSDGCSPLAITVLVLGFLVSRLDFASDPLLKEAHFAQVLQFFPYVTSFATIGTIWLNHHTLFHEAEKVGRRTLITQPPAVV